MRESIRIKTAQHNITTEDSMKKLVLTSLIVLALAAGSVFATQNKNAAKPKAAAAAKAPAAEKAPAAGGDMKMSGKKHHRKHHRHHANKA
jgi:hypothetical protein